MTKTKVELCIRALGIIPHFFWNPAWSWVGVDQLHRTYISWQGTSAENCKAIKEWFDYDKDYHYSPLHTQREIISLLPHDKKKTRCNIVISIICWAFSDLDQVNAQCLIAIDTMNFGATLDSTLGERLIQWQQFSLISRTQFHKQVLTFSLLWSHGSCHTWNTTGHIFKKNKASMLIQGVCLFFFFKLKKCRLLQREVWSMEKIE